MKKKKPPGQRFQLSYYKPRNDKNYWRPPKGSRGHRGFYPRDCRGNTACGHLELRCLASVTITRKSCSFKPPNFYSFVSAALRTQTRKRMCLGCCSNEYQVMANRFPGLNGLLATSFYPSPISTFLTSISQFSPFSEDTTFPVPHATLPSPFY